MKMEPASQLTAENVSKMLHVINEKYHEVRIPS